MISKSGDVCVCMCVCVCVSPTLSFKRTQNSLINDGIVCELPQYQNPFFIKKGFTEASEHK